MFKHAIAFAAVLAASPLQAAPWPTALPDPCTNVRDRGPLTTANPPNTPPLSWHIAYPSSYAGMEASLRGVIFIVNGNGASYYNYVDLGKHLARQDFLVRLIQRPNAAFAVADVAEAMEDTFEQFSLPEDFPVVMMGHSMGGGSVMEVTRLFHGVYNIDAVISLAPNAEGVSGFLGTESPAYLALYGSQDEDMTGTGGDPHEAFMAYDMVNGEWTTASPVNRWIFVTPDRVDKAMVYVRGADHSGFIRKEGLTFNKFEDYLSPDDQFCIAKAYITAFIDWKLGDMVGYRDMFHGGIRPPSIAGIHTDAADHFGNPAGQPVEIFHQFSPRKRFVLADFSSEPAMSVGFNMQAGTLYPFASDTRARHETGALRLGWRSSPFMRALTISVPVNRRQLAAFDTLQLRIGQIDTGDPNYANAGQAEPPLMISLVDGEGQSVNRVLNSYGPIPGHDARSNMSRGHSHMNTIRIPMDDLDSINLADVRSIRFWVYPNTKGEVMIDSIEAVYDF